MVLEGRAHLDRLGVHDIRDASCPGGDAAGIRAGVSGSDLPIEGPADVTVDRSEVTRVAGRAIDYAVDATGKVQRSRISDSRYGVAALGSTPGPLVVRSNELTGMTDVGIVFAHTDRLSVHANRLARNVNGIQGFDSRLGRIERNSVRDSAVDGIALQNTSFVVSGNTSLGSGRFDCHDVSGTPLVDRWTGNVGVTQSPAGICRSPG